VYLVFFCYLTSIISGNYLTSIEKAREADPSKRFYGWVELTACQTITFICMYCIYVFSFKLEIVQFIASPMGYLQDLWNWVDLLSFIFNFWFLIFLNINVGMG